MTLSSKRGDSLELKAYEYVKKRIMRRIYAPGQKILDSKIAGELNFSRTPVRDALRRLEHEGFLVGQAGKGWNVYALSLEDIHEIFDVKVELEGMLARKAAACTDKRLRAALKKALDGMKAAEKEKDNETWRKNDMELHRIMLSMADNKRAARVINDLNDQWYRVRIGLVAMEGRVHRSNIEHTAFVESILAGNGDDAAQQMRSHLNNLRQEIVNVLVNLVLPFAQNGI
ncbi:MAG: GntR family transcriptional regulator [Desulfobacterales bacterium]|nr:MAG: GntR family transcriptional regulator [Desulfobacterales bacterium]